MNNYRVYDGKTGDLIVEGTAEECAKALNMQTISFKSNSYLSEQGKYKKYKIVTCDLPEPRMQSGYAEAIQSWDDFVTPIRERFGIPVRHLGEGKK
jgi:hypothetical protein